MVSLTRCLEFGVSGFVGPLFAEDLVQRPGDGDLGLFKVHITDLFARLEEFLHQVVVGRRDAAVRGWRSWIREEPGSRFYKWSRPDLVPPSPSLCCDPSITAGGSGILTFLCESANNFRMPGSHTFAGEKGLLLMLMSLPLRFRCGFQG